ncbi:MAG: SulP family inorganic anion transporter [Pseudomonadota bacterium]
MRVDPAQIIPALGWMPRLTRRDLRADSIAGLTGAAIVLPQGVAFAIIAGLPPEYGVYTAIVTAFVAALFGSSSVMVSGPTTAISVVVFTTLAPMAEPGSARYVELALLLTVMVGIIQIVAALARLGQIVAFVSHSVMTGFTAAAALLIGVSQLPDALGVTVERGGTVVDRLVRTVEAADALSLAALTISAATLVTVAVLQSISKKLPGFLVALVVGGGIGWLFRNSGTEVPMVGALPAALPAFYIPVFDFSDVSLLGQGAFAIALIGLLEALSIGRAMAIRRHERFNATQEIFGQGLSNLVGGFFQCYVGSGSFTRSGINMEVGARTPLAAMLSSVFLAAMTLLLLPLIAFIPTPAIAGLILYVAWRLIDRREIRHILTSSSSETAVLGVTFAAGLLVELDFAIYLGVIASLMVFLHKTSQPVLGVGAPKLVNGQRKFVGASENNLPECPQITILRLDGTLYFGSVEHVERAFRRVERERPQARIKVLILKGVGNIDLAGADLLIDEIRQARARGGEFHMIAQFAPLLNRMARLHVLDELHEANLHLNKGTAIEAAVAQADNEICRTCRLRVYHECAGKPGARAALRELGY